ncbi:hypothetical protein F2P79_010200 [Pimephales promelas]|nr:hypothetical protein F2P79_010200 [Pimephales promelas]
MDWWCNSLRVELENTHIFLQEKLNACGSPCSGLFLKHSVIIDPTNFRDPSDPVTLHVNTRTSGGGVTIPKPTNHRRGDKRCRLLLVSAPINHMVSPLSSRTHFIPRASHGSVMHLRWAFDRPDDEHQSIPGRPRLETRQPPT